MKFLYGKRKRGVILCGAAWWVLRERTVRMCFWVDSKESFDPLRTKAERLAVRVAVFFETRQRRKQERELGPGSCIWPPAGAMRIEKQMARENERRRRRERERTLEAKGRERR